MNKHEEMKIMQILWIIITLGAILMIIMAFIVGCTYNVSLVHTEGTASDVIDTQQTAQPDISATLPIKAI